MPLLRVRSAPQMACGVETRAFTHKRRIARTRDSDKLEMKQDSLRTVDGWAVAWRTIILAWRFTAYAMGAIAGLCSLADLVAAMGPMCVKLAQAATTRPDLFRRDLVEALWPLQDRVPPQHVDDLPHGCALLASGSIAQIYSYDDPDNCTMEPRPVDFDNGDGHYSESLVIKIKRPGVDQCAAVDHAILSWLFATCVGRAIVGLVCKRPLVCDAIEHLVESMHEAIHQHLDFEAEADNMERMGSLFPRNSKSTVIVPRVVRRLCTRDRLVMERIEGGVPIAGLPSAAARAAAADLVVRAVCEMVFKHGFLHGDVHEGNVLALPADTDEPDARVRLALLDMGIVYCMTDEQRRLVGMLVRAAATRNADLLASNVYVNSTARSAPYASFCRDVADAIERGRCGSDLGALLDGLVAACSRNRVPIERSMVGVMAALVAADGIARRYKASSLTTIAWLLCCCDLDTRPAA